jgi:hypothetical protein
MTSLMEQLQEGDDTVGSDESIDSTKGNKCVMYCTYTSVFLSAIFLLFFLLTFAIIVFHVALYPVVYEFISVAEKEKLYQIILGYFGVFSEFGTFFMLLVIVFNFVNYKSLINTNYEGEKSSSVLTLTAINIGLLFLILIFFFMVYFIPLLLPLYIVFFIFHLTLNPILWCYKERYGNSEGEFILCKFLCTFLFRLCNVCQRDLEADDKEKKIENMDEIDDLKENIKLTLIETEKYISESTNEKSGNEKQEEESFSKLKFYSEYLMDKAEDTIKDNQACNKYFKMARSFNMFGNKEFEKDNRYCNLYYVIILSVLVLIGQIYKIFEMPFEEGSTVIAIISFRIIFLYCALDYNIYDSIINFKRTKKVIGPKGHIPLYIMYAVYVVGLISSIIAIIFIRVNKMPDISNIKFIENNETWTDYNITHSYIPDFCKATARADSIYSVEDFAFMTTLPRLYKVDGNKCSINPKLRGVFNTTMKYIFGKDYKDQGIKIYCYTGTRYPYLTITSDRLFEEVNSTITNHSDFEIYYEYNTSSPIPYFDVDSLCSDNYASTECESLKNCINETGGGDCEGEWEEYSNKYWEEYPNESLNIDEFSDYEITVPIYESEENINESEQFSFKPRLVSLSDNETNVTGQHFIVGGGYEDTWGYSFLTEVFVRTYLPLIFGSIIPFCSIYEIMTPMLFKASEFMAGLFFGIIRKQQLEYYKINSLLDRFKFNETSIYTIGHSVSAASMKGIGRIIRIPGITFETQTTKSLYIGFDGIGNNVGSSRVNVYSMGMMLSAFDNLYAINGKLPKLFFNPNVYDTACLTTVVCSPTTKYVPLCKQVLNQSEDEPENTFQKILVAYNSFINLTATESVFMNI